MVRRRVNVPHLGVVVEPNLSQILSVLEEAASVRLKDRLDLRKFYNKVTAVASDALAHRVWKGRDILLYQRTQRGDQPFHMGDHDYARTLLWELYGVSGRDDWKLNPPSERDVSPGFEEARAWADQARWEDWQQLYEYLRERNIKSVLNMSVLYGVLRYLHGGIYPPRMIRLANESLFTETQAVRMVYDWWSDLVADPNNSPHSIESRIRKDNIPLWAQIWSIFREWMDSNDLPRMTRLRYDDPDAEWDMVRLMAVVDNKLHAYRFSDAGQHDTFWGYVKNLDMAFQSGQEMKHFQSVYDGMCLAYKVLSRPTREEKEAKKRLDKAFAAALKA